MREVHRHALIDLRHCEELLPFRGEYVTLTYDPDHVLTLYIYTQSTGDRSGEFIGCAHAIDLDTQDLSWDELKQLNKVRSTAKLAIHVPVEVLAPTIDFTDLLAKMATIEELFKTAFIPTDRHSEYARWIDELRILKHCGGAIGPRDVGNSRSCVHYRDEDRKRVSCVKAWSKSI